MTKKNVIEKTYVKLSPIEHILKRSGMYLGDIDFKDEKQLIYLDNQIIQKEINFSSGLYKIFDEILVNTIDSSVRDKYVKIIKAIINPEFFSIYNDGIGIDVIKHPEHKIYVPELIFGHLLTSTNYDDDVERIYGGQFGYGAKLTAIFSTKFIVEVWDQKRKLYYYQEFENNLTKISKAKIEKMKEIKGGVKITSYPDFEKFKTTKFSADMLNLLYRRVNDLLALTKKDINIYLNDIQLKREHGFKDFLKLFPSNDEWIIGKCIKNPHWEFSIKFNDGKTMEHNTHISFVNGIYTNKGGTHINYLENLLFEKFQKIIGNEFTKRHLRDYLMICLKTTIINPSFNSQTKEELTTPINKFGFDCDISKDFWDQIKNSELITKLKEIVSLSSQKVIAKYDGSKKNKLKHIPKLEDANFAGTKKSIECVLILTEGDSAKATAISGISAISNGRNYYGVYPLRGKLLNVREASTSQINNNQEIIDIKKILGLKSGTQYNKDNIQDLRYGAVMLMTDADEDGSHIKGLIINFFDYFFPSLLEIEGFIRILQTPLVKATKKEIILNFANIRAYKVWKEKTADNYLWKIKYYKGLGTSTSKEAAEYFKNINNNTVNIINKQDNKDILLAFSKTKVNERKLWLQNYNPDKILSIDPPTTITIKEFINQELIHFSNYDNIRSIPSIMDGLKPSQRKVLFACFKRNLINELKVAQLAAAVAEIASYHHGEQSLVATIINMAQDFVGSNNLNLLKPIGQLGTRIEGGKDNASARYIYTQLETYTDKIFHKIDNELLDYLDDDGITIEPKYYIPIIPMILINGSEGIGTGFSTNIVNYNPNDIIEWLIHKLKGTTFKKDLIPFYRGFKGNIIKYDETTFVSEGVITINKNEIIITELPIKMWTSNYKEFLEELIYEKKNSLFKSYINLSSDVDIHFVLKFDATNFNIINKMFLTIDSDNLNQLYKYLKLYKTIKISNMHLYTNDFKIKLYKSAEEILNEFYKIRLQFYNKRKELLIIKLKADIEYVNNQIKFIKLVIDSDRKIFSLNENELIIFLGKNKITKFNDSYDYLINMTFKQLTTNNLEKLVIKLKNFKINLTKLEEKTNKDLWINDLNELKKLFNN